MIMKKALDLRYSYRKKVKGENVEKSKSQESFWHKLLKLFGL